MPSALPLAGPAPADGLLSASAAVGAGERALGVYVHVPFCAARCGYCDFNTYTASELGPADLPGASRDGYAAAAAAEVGYAARVLEASGLPARPAATVFVGGGTPTLLPARDLAAVLGAVRSELGLAEGAEVTTEANPDSVTPGSLRQLARAGFTRVSFGMQSAVPRVLGVLERTHDPARVPQAVAWARDAGLAVSLDLIYGTPGESTADWRASLDAALACEPDHVSAYALVVEEGTAMAARVRRGQLPEPDEDDLADKYELADDVLAAAGMGWYEVSNWARSPEHACRHNLGYWRGQDWWGAGPGAHSHVGGVRWWNAKHPAAYAARVAAGASPAVGREVLADDDRRVEAVLLGVRLAEGLPLAAVPPAGRAAVPALAAAGLVEALGGPGCGRVVLTRSGRLLADAVVRVLLGWDDAPAAPSGPDAAAPSG
ncbi:radical SAM family heme chaperone HemW [Quadrisphaera sp. DSM 44207]|uniref:radical SAM family heme chaperone HemW n=1 Tax=Quadrisphaera sp. DSM 44207 TaxID=1881057 RepID=UPI000B86CEF9|nr:radical SAM family heme chaperone HemW [Quadrisphaera sp. DSM 44207]